MSNKQIENCSVIKEAISLGVGRPEQYDGQCEGYAAEDRDEPIIRCRKCRLNTMYEE